MKRQNLNDILVIYPLYLIFRTFLRYRIAKRRKNTKKIGFYTRTCGNLIAVYCLPRKILEISPDFNHFVTCYWKEHYSLWPWDELEQGEELKNIFRKKIQKSVGNIDIHDAKSVANAIEFFNGYERQAKFIVNSVRVYEYFGYAWRIPIVDRELNDFFLKVPLQYRMTTRIIYICNMQKMFFLLKILKNYRILTVQQKSPVIWLIYPRKNVKIL